MIVHLPDVLKTCRSCTELLTAKLHVTAKVLPLMLARMKPSMFVHKYWLDDGTTKAAYLKNFYYVHGIDKQRGHLHV